MLAGMLLVSVLLFAATGPLFVAAGTAEGASIAWVRFENAGFKYAGKPYHWLGHGDIELVIDAKPRPDHVLELLWGSKNDTRDAVATVDGHEVKLRSGPYDGFPWLQVPLPEKIDSDQYRITLKQVSQPQAFIAEVRLLGKAEGGALPDAKQSSHRITFTTAKVPAAVAGSSAFPEMRALWNRNLAPFAKPPSDPHQEAAFRRAARNGLLANQAFFRSRRFIDGWLKHADPKTGLIPRNLGRNRDFWNAKDAAADNYPFMVITSAMTDRPLFAGRMHEMLRTETTLTRRIGNMPDDYSFVKQGFLRDKPNLDAIIFGSSEYMKDGLISITEWLGRCPWTERLQGILDDVWKHAPVETPRGKIPSTNTEVNGEMLQVTCRMYWMTGEKKYLNYALRLGDYYLLGNHHPTRDADRLRLIAHGGEIVSGLCELYVTCHFASPEKKKAYEKPLHEMLDRILEVGINEHGMVFTSINPKIGQHEKRICDTWGYTYNAYYMVYMVDKTEAYRNAVLKAMRSMNEHYRDYGWEGGSNDGYADSIESCLNLYNREPVASAAEWMDHEIQYTFRRQKPDGVIEGWHGDGNSARTWLLYALWKTRGLTIEPWRRDIRFGAVEQNGKLYVSLIADKPWSGRLIFDKTRHKVYLHLPIDYPRLNQFPEWFTVNSQSRYTIHDVAADKRTTLTGKQLLDGMPIELKPGVEVRLIVTPIKKSVLNNR